MGARDATRRIDLAKIHIARKQLGLEDEVYRAIVRRVSARYRIEPAESSAVLDPRERAALLAELSSLGFKVAPPRAKREDWIEGRNPHTRKLLACWFDLVRAGASKHPGKKALRHFIRRATGKEAIEWLSPEECSKVIEELKAWHRRVSERGCDGALG